jgi:methyl acetate hydrolase
MLYEGAFGKRDLVKGTDMTLHSVFWIPSMTKALTATAAMQLVEQGKLKLDEPIAILIWRHPRFLKGSTTRANPSCVRPRDRSRCATRGVA